MIHYERDAADELWAVADVVVGAEHTRFRVPLGRWEAAEPGRAGLAELPVVVLPGDAWADLVSAAASWSGGASVREVSPDGHGLLSAAETGIDVLIVRAGNGRAMNVTRTLGGRPLPALPSADPSEVRAFLDGCHVDLDIAIPVVDDRRREALRSSLAPLRLEDVHHLVEVDPGPGLAAAGIGAGTANEAATWAAAAGVLAGRLAAGSRRYRMHDR